ncbi:MAG: septum formation initiator family protein [Candidatus Magasanikbacteria bacterium]|nr:septum formation initiator family protein [Candidatus Magasanikbacteria bacterium]
MANNKDQNQKWKEVFYSRWFLALLFILTLLLIISYVRAYYQEYQVRQEISNLQAQLHSLESKKIETMEFLKYAQSSTFVEEKARTELNLVKPGENMVIIANGTDSDTNRQEKTNMIKWSQVSNPIKWFKFFFITN